MIVHHGSAVINLSDPQTADITLRLGEPDHLIWACLPGFRRRCISDCSSKAGVDLLRWSR